MKFIRGEQGSVSVFLVCILVPLVVLECFAIDYVRLASAKTLINEGVYMAVNGAMSGYNHELKKGYGLFALDDPEHVGTYADLCFQETVDPEGSGLLSGECSNLLPVSAKLTTKIDKNSSLENDEILNEQIYEFMKYYNNYGISGPDCLTAGSTYIRPMLETVKSKLAYDRKLNEVGESLQWSANILESVPDGDIESYFGEDAERIEKEIKEAFVTAEKLYREAQELWKSWNRCIDKKRLPDSMYSYMRKRADATKNLVRFSKISISEDGIEYLLSLCQDPKGSSSDRSAAANELNGLLYYGDVDYHTFHVCGNVYQRIGNMPYSPKEKVLDQTMSTEKAAEILQEICDQTDHYDEIESMLSEDLNEDVLLSEYVSGMFSSFRGKPGSIAGDSYRYGVVTRSGLFAEQEYILTGGSSTEENERLIYARIFEYFYLWETMDYFAAQSSSQKEALAKAKRLTGNNVCSVPMHEDLFLLGMAAKHVNVDLLGKEGMADSTFHGTEAYCAKLFCGDGYRYISYNYMLKLFLLTDIKTERELYLSRIRQVIEKNMVASGYTGFSMRNSYTKLRVCADVTVKTTFVPKRIFKTESGLSY